MCGGGESEQVSNRSRTKDRDPESADVLMCGGVSARWCNGEHRFDDSSLRRSGTNLRLRHARA